MILYLHSTPYVNMKHNKKSREREFSSADIKMFNDA
jgi:hypothetical protein